MSVALPFGRSDSEAANAWLAGLGLATIALSLFVLAILSPKVLGDGDTWSHLATGQWILAHGAIPRTDPFSYTMPGAPWTAHEWLSEILLTLAFRLAGWSGVVVLTAVAATSAALIVGLIAARDLRGAPLLVTVGLGVGLMTESLLVRPHILALPIAAAWCAGLIAARRHGRAPPLALAMLMILWANMHGGFIFGLALIGPIALEAVIEARANARLGTAIDWALFGCASVAAALINPYGGEALIFPFRLMSVENLSRISEWRPQDFSHLGPMEIALFALIGFALTRPLSLPPIRTALLLALIAMALAHARHQLLLGLLAPMLLAPAVAKAVAQEPAGDWRLVARIALAATAAGCLAFGAARFVAPVERVDGTAAPIAALEAVPPELRMKPVLNDYAFGGYLIWSHVRPFIDARADMYGDAMLSLYGQLSAGDAGTIEDVLKRYGVAWTIFSPDSKAVAALDREPGWRRLYTDAYAVVHIRQDGTPEPMGLRGD